MPIKQNAESIEDELYLAKLAMDEVEEDVGLEEGTVVEDGLVQQNDTTTKETLAQALDEALDYSNPNYDPTDKEAKTKEEESVEAERSDKVFAPGDATMDKAPSAATVQDADVSDDGDSDEELHRTWEKQELKKAVPELPQSLGGAEKTDGNGLVYLDYTFTIDPSKYRSPNYQPIADAGAVDVRLIGGFPRITKEDLFESEGSDNVDEVEAASETIEREPSAEEEQSAAQDANEEQKEQESLGKPIEGDKDAEDENPEQVVLDYATFIDGSSFMCCDEIDGIDYSQIAMDAGVKKPATRQTCKTTFAQCRAKNPLYCRFHGPKLLEKDIKTAISASLGNGCVVSVTKDKGQKNPLTFRLTVGCAPSMKEKVSQFIKKYMSSIPGVSSPEEFKDIDKKTLTAEFGLDVMKADEPPKGDGGKSQTEKLADKKNVSPAFKKIFGKKKAEPEEMPVVGATPAKIEKKANEIKAQEADTDGEQEKDGTEQEKPMEEPKPEEPTDLAKDEPDPEQELGDVKDIPVAKEEDYDKKFTQLVDEAMEKGLFDIEEFKEGYDDINNDNATYSSSAKQVEALEKLMNGTDWESKKPQPTEEEKEKKSYEDEFNAALMEYPEGGGGSDNDAKNIEINEAFTKAFIGNDAEGMKSAIEAMKKLVSDAKTKGGESYGVSEMLKVLSGVNSAVPDFLVSYDAMDAVKTQDPTDIKISAKGDGDFGKMMDTINHMFKDSGFEVQGTNGKDMSIVKKGGETAADESSDDVDETANKMFKELKSIADNNPMLVLADDQVSALYYGVDQALFYLKHFKLGLDEMKGKLKEYGGKKNPSVGKAILKKTIEKAIEKQKDKYDEAKAYAEFAMKDLKQAVEKANNHIVEEIKGSCAGQVEEIVKNVATTIWPKGKPADVESVADMIDALLDDVNDVAKEKFGSDDKMLKWYDGVKKAKLNKDYLAVSSASLEFDAEVYDFKSKIDSTHSKESAEMLKGAVALIGKKAQALKDAFAAYKMAVDKVKKDVTDLAEIKEKEKKLSQNSSGNTMDLSGDLAKYVGLDTEPNGQFKSASADFYPNLGNAISAALQKDGHFTNFKTTNDYDSHKLYLSIEKKQKEGFDEDEDIKVVPTAEEEEKIEQTLNQELSKVGLSLAKGSGISIGAKVKWEIVAKPKGKGKKTTTNTPSAATPQMDIKAKIAAMSVKEKMEKSIPLLEKKIMAEPNNEKWQKMLKQAKAYLASHKD